MTLLVDPSPDQKHVESTSDVPERASEAITEPLSTNEESSEPEEHLLPRCYPRWRGKPLYNGNQEALGWALDAIGRSVSFIGAGAFLSTAVLQLAKQAAGCDLEGPCNTRVYGIRPSSLLTTYTIIVGVLSAAFLPLMGAVVDYTDHRLLVGRVTSFSFSVLLFPQIFLNENTWFAVAILLLLTAFIGWAQTMVTYAYLPELTEDEATLTAYTQSFTVVSFSSMVVYLAVVVGIASAVGFMDDSIATAHLGQSIAFCVSSVLLYIAWGRLLRRRPAARALPPGRSLWTAGFVQVFRTSLDIYRHRPALKWFYLSVALIDAATGALATVAITYLTDTLQFTSIENGLAVLLMLLGSVPGAMMAGRAIPRCNPVRVSIAGTLILALNTIAVAIVLQGPGQQLATYAFTFVWGLGTGCKWTTDRLLASTLIPDGQDAELMGVYLFAGQIITWLPPLIVTVLNEAGIDQRIGIGTMSVYYFLGVGALLMIGDYRAAVTSAGRIRLGATNIVEDEDEVEPELPRNIVQTDATCK